MPLPSGFVLNGISTEDSMPLPPRIKRVIAVLDELPFKEVLATRQLLPLARTSGNNFSTYTVLDSYKVQIDGKMFWGNTKTITELKKQLGEPNED